MKKQGVWFFVLRALACQLQNQADLLFSLIGEEERPLPRKQPGAQSGTALQQATAREQRLSSAEAETLPAHWLAPGGRDEPPAHWVRLVQQAKPTSFATGVKASSSSVLPARPAEIKARRADSRLITPLPGMPASPSTDRWNGIQELPVEANQPETTETEAQPLDLELDEPERKEAASVSAPAFHPGETSHKALAPRPLPAPQSSIALNVTRARPGEKRAPTLALVNREKALRSRTKEPGRPSQSRQDQTNVPGFQQETAQQGSKLALRGQKAPSGEQRAEDIPMIGETQGILPAIEKTADLSSSVRQSWQDADQSSMPWPERKQETLSALQIRDGQSIRRAERTAYALPATPIGNGDQGMSSQWHARGEQGLNNAGKTSEWVNAMDADTRQPQDRWPDQPMRPDLLPERREFSAGNSRPASHLSRAETGMVAPTGMSFSTDRPDQGNQAEEGWPSLPDEKTSSSQDWRTMRQVWEHQQRLDDEQRGNVWNAQLFY